MERRVVEKYFEKIGARITIRKGTSPRGGVLRMNVATDRKGEHFTLTIHPDIEDSEITITLLDYDDKLSQMLLLIRFPELVRKRGSMTSVKTKFFDTQRLLVGKDEMHWFVAGVTQSTNIRQAFENLRPQAVRVAIKRNGVKSKDWRKRKTKGFIRQGEWFFVPVHFVEDEKTIIHKNEPIFRPGGGKPHYVEELIRFNGDVVYVRGNDVISEDQYKNVKDSDKIFYHQQMRVARALGRGKVKHSDHHTIELKGWHEIHISAEVGVSTNAFID